MKCARDFKLNIYRTDMDDLKKETTANQDNGRSLHPMLATALKLDNKSLAKAYDILFNESKNWSEEWKAKEMVSLFENQMQVCKPFENYIKCIEFLQRCC